MAAAAAAAPVLRAMMVLATIAFIACAYHLSFLWFFVWRFASGLSGGVLMVLAAPVVLLHVPPSRRGFASGSEEHTSELKSLMRISYAVFCLKNKNDHCSLEK